MPPSADHHTTSDPQIFWSTFVLPRLVQTEGISPRDKNGAVVRARRALDAELSAMHLAMCSIRTRCNALAPISVLPAEALARIFQFCVAMYPPDLHKSNSLGWIEVTHVCRHWRDTALQFPSLWVDICHTLGSQCCEAMLMRSKAAPISLRRHVTGASQGSLNRICEHFPHTRELMLAGPPAVLKLIIDALPPPPAILETLVVGPADIKTLKDSGDSFELPAAIAASHPPSFRHLALRAVRVPWSAPILCGLTYLELQLYYPQNLPAGSYSNSSWETLFGALRNMPDLESLTLKDCFPSGPCKDAGHGLLQLPRLSVLQLQGPSISCFGIAAQLQIPPSCQVQLRCEDDADVTKILPFLTAHFHDGVDLPPWYILSITKVNRLNQFRLEMWRHSDLLGEEEDWFKPKAYADLAIWFHSQQRPIDPLKALCRALPLQTILTLRVDADGDISDGDWIDLLGQCTSAQEASVSGPWGTSFCTALGMTTDDASGASSVNATHEAFLKNLEYLRLLGMDFRNWRYEGWDVDDWELTGWLTDRQKDEAIPKLWIDLKDCSIRREWVQRLRDEALRVDWDEDEGMCEDESEGFDGSSDG